MPIKLESRVRLVELLVVPSLSRDLILGIDIWVVMDIVPNLRSKCWAFAETCPPKAKVSAVVAHDNLANEQRNWLNSLL